MLLKINNSKYLIVCPFCVSWETWRWWQSQHMQHMQHIDGSVIASMGGWTLDEIKDTNKTIVEGASCFSQDQTLSPTFCFSFGVLSFNTWTSGTIYISTSLFILNHSPRFWLTGGSVLQAFVKLFWAFARAIEHNMPRSFIQESQYSKRVDVVFLQQPKYIP